MKNQLKIDLKPNGTYPLNYTSTLSKTFLPVFMVFKSVKNLFILLFWNNTAIIRLILTISLIIFLLTKIQISRFGVLILFIGYLLLEMIWMNYSAIQVEQRKDKEYDNLVDLWI